MLPHTFPDKIDFIWSARPSSELVPYHRKTFLCFSGDGVVFHFREFHNSFVMPKENENFLSLLYTKSKHIKLLCLNNMLLAHDRWGDGIYHFIIDTVSRIQNYIMNGGDTKKCCIVLPKTQFLIKFGQSFFAEFGYIFKDIVWVDSNTLYLNFNHSFVLPLPHVMGSNNLNVMKAIQKRIFSFTRFPISTPLEKVYYYRSGSKRLVINNDEVIGLMNHFNYICIDFASLSMHETLRLMASTKILIGIHGAGLTNMVFMPAGGKVIEFKTKDPNPNNHCYFHLAHSLGHDYIQFTADSIFGNNLTIEGNGCDIFVDTKILKNLLSLVECD